MPRLCWLLVALLLSGCARQAPRLPELTGNSGSREGGTACTTVFPKGQWQLVHSIDFVMADGSSGTAVGVLVLAENEMGCALMTVEGMTLFEARAASDGRVTTLRAVPPFDNKEFAAGLMRDVRTIFQPPGGEVRYGQVAGGAPVCRYTAADGQVTDILPAADGCWQLQTYTADRVRSRSLVTRSCKPIGAEVFPESLELTAHGATGYTLKMRLISAEKLNAGQ